MCCIYLLIKASTKMRYLLFLQKVVVWYAVCRVIVEVWSSCIAFLYPRISQISRSLPIKNVLLHGQLMTLWSLVMSQLKIVSSAECVCIRLPPGMFALNVEQGEIRGTPALRPVGAYFTLGKEQARVARLLTEALLAILLSFPFSALYFNSSQRTHTLSPSNSSSRRFPASRNVLGLGGSNWLQSNHYKSHKFNINMASFIAKQLIGNQLDSVKGELATFHYSFMRSPLIVNRYSFVAIIVLTRKCKINSLYTSFSL